MELIEKYKILKKTAIEFMLNGDIENYVYKMIEMEKIKSNILPFYINN